MYTCKKFDRAHSCLRFLIREYKIREMYIPYYLCDVIRHTLFEEGCKPLFYHIDDYFMPLTDFPKESFILYPNYFGICRKNVEKLSKKYPKLIIDNAHAFFDDINGFACFNSGAKFGFGETAYLWIKDKNARNNMQSEDYCFSDQTSANSLFLHKKQKCRNRFIEIHKTYSGINCLNINISENMFPFCYPLLTDTTETADKIVKELKKEGLTIYRYWNTLPKNFNEYKFYSRLVPIPIADVV